jgi:hypothetical protein
MLKAVGSKRTLMTRPQRFNTLPAEVDLDASEHKTGCTKKDSDDGVAARLPACTARGNRSGVQVVHLGHELWIVGRATQVERGRVIIGIVNDRYDVVASRRVEP